MKPITVLVTACGAPGAPGIIKSLRQNGERDIRIIGTDMNAAAVGFSMVDNHRVMPAGEDPCYVPELLALAIQEQVEVILPLATYELMALSENIDIFTRNKITVCISNPDELRLANNKGLLFKLMDQSNLPTPRSVMVWDVGSFKKAVFELGYPAQPVCFKPQVGHGGRGFRVLDSRLDRYESLFFTKPDTSISTLDEILTIIESKNETIPLVVMEYLPGAEFSVDMLLHDNNSLVTVIRRRTRSEQGISFIGQVVEDDILKGLAERCAEVLGLDYCINMQFKQDLSGDCKIIEVNPRLSGTIVLCTAAGVNLPYLAVKLALGEKLPQLELQYGTQVFRYWEEVFCNAEGKYFRI